MRYWVCPKCERIEKRSYEHLAQYGSPYCPDCAKHSNVEMLLIPDVAGVVVVEGGVVSECMTVDSRPILIVDFDVEGSDSDKIKRGPDLSECFLIDEQSVYETPEEETLAVQRHVAGLLPAIQKRRKRLARSNEKRGG